MRKRKRRDDVYLTAEGLIAAVERHLMHMSPYPMWHVGTARRAERRYDELFAPPFWAFWVAADETIAQAVVQHFAAKGMKPDPSPEPGAMVYLY
jgi:hypothetical protein